MTKPADLTCALNGRQTQAARRLPRRRLPLPLTRTRHKLPGVYRVGADRVLTKRRASSAVQENALAAMMRDLDDLEDEADDYVTISCRSSVRGSL